MAIADCKSAVEIWEVRTGKLALCLPDETGSTAHVDFSPDDRFLSTASHDGTIRVWDLERTSVITRIDGASSSFPCAAWSPNGLLFTVNLGARLRSVSTTDWTYSIFDDDDDDYFAQIAKVAWSPNGLALAVVYEGGRVFLREWDGVAFREIEENLFERSLPIKECRDIAWSPDGCQFASISEGFQSERNLMIWDLPVQGRKGVGFVRSHCHFFDVRHAAIGFLSGKDCRLVTGVMYYEPYMTDGFVEYRIWPCYLDQPIYELTEDVGDYGVGAVAVHPTKPIFATVGVGGAVSIWQIDE